MKKIYICTLTPTDLEIPEGMPPGSPGTTIDKVVIADNVSEVEAIIGKDFILERMVNIEKWVLADTNNPDGIFYMADTVCAAIDGDSATESIQFFIQASTFSELEDVIQIECGENFRYIKTIEKSPYEVLGI